MRAFLASVALAFSVLFWAGPKAQAASYTDEVERDFPLKSIGTLHLINRLGSISVQGWSIDKVRVRVQRKVEAETSEEAQALFRSLDLEFEEDGKNVELSVTAGKGLDLESRLKERKTPRAEVSLVVRAPAGLTLKLWSVAGDLAVRSWNAPIEARSFSGTVQIQDVTAKNQGVSAVCPACRFDLSDIRGSLKVLGGSGSVSARKVSGKEIYLESASGPLTLEEIAGRQLYVTGEGALKADQLKGNIEFKTAAGSVEMVGVNGFISGRTTSGEMRISVDRWEFDEPALLESESGPIELSLPGTFSARADLYSREGKVLVSDLVFRPAKKEDPLPSGGSPVGLRYQGILGASGVLRKLGETRSERELRVSSQRGNVRILRRS